MIPIKNASRDMKRAESPMKERTRLRALAIGLRLITTAAPKPSMTRAKSQKRRRGISKFRILDWGLESEMGYDHAIRNPKSAACNGLSFLLVPFQDYPVHDAADFEELLFVMHHFGTGEACNGVIFP